jgi:NAD(P)-dependent dehydrogenase (short-subunit alcohol dehydrogenase family)
MKRLKNKIALITGATGGIGSATAKKMAKEGATVIVTDLCPKQGKELIQELGNNSVYFDLDVSDEKAWQEITQKIKDQFGKIDILFNNAGVIGMSEKCGPQDPEHASLESWHSVHRINLDGVFLGCKYGIQLMKQNGGSIINMSSRSGLVGIPHAAAYASSKAAIRNHTKSVALWCAQQDYNIRCNSIHPAAILTPLWCPLLGKDREAAIKSVENGIPLGRMGTPEDVAGVVVFLASDESSYMTGSEIVLDGGILAGAASSPKKH